MYRIVKTALPLILASMALQPFTCEIATGAPQKQRQNRKRSSAKPASATKVFAQAKAFYDQGKFNECLGVLSDLLRRYPDHEAAQLLMAKSFYRLERQPEAYTMFARMNPQYLDPETSYEYATTMYKAKQYTQALYAYKNVPKNHSLYDLANYYGALSAIKLRKFKEAEEMMERAVVLPDKLSRSKTQYLKHLTELRLLREKQTLAKQKKIERDRLRKVRKSGETGKKPENDQTPATPPEYKHAGVMSISKGASVSASSKSQISDYHGFGKQTANTRVSSFSFAEGPLWSFGNGDRRTALGLQLRVGASDVHSTGEEKRDFVFNTTKDIIRIKTTESKSAQKSGDVGGTIFVDIPAPSDVWFAVGAQVDFNYIDFERAQRSGVQGGFLAAKGNWQGTGLSSKLAFLEYVDAENEPFMNQIAFTAGTSFTKFKDLGFSFTLAVDNFDYLESKTPGPDTSIRVLGALSKPFVEFVSGSLSASYDNQSQNTLYGLGSYEEIRADGQIMGATMALSISPWSWLNIDLSTGIQQSTWTVTAPEGAQETFERNQFDVLQTNQATLTINLNF